MVEQRPGKNHPLSSLPRLLFASCPFFRTSQLSQPPSHGFTCFVSHSLRLFSDRPLPLPDLFSCKEHDFWEPYFIFPSSPCGLAWMHIVRERCCMDCRERIKLIDHSLSGQGEKNANKHCVASPPCCSTGCAGTPDSLILWLSGLLLSLKPNGYGLETLSLTNHVALGSFLCPQA